MRVIHCHGWRWAPSLMLGVMQAQPLPIAQSCTRLRKCDRSLETLQKLTTKREFQSDGL